MSRSYRKPYTSFVGGRSNKKDRTAANRTLRCRVNTVLHGVDFENDPDIVSFPILRECSNVYNFSTDGLPYYADTRCDKEFVKQICRK